MKEHNQYIEGAGGGGSSRTPREAANTLQSRATIKVQEVLSEGPIVGVVGDLRGVRLDGTRVQNVNGTFNYPAIYFDTRTGLPDQTYMEGFPAVESSFLINVEITDTTPLIRTTTSNDIDALRVTVRLPQGLSSTDKKNGDVNGYRTGVVIQVKPSNSTVWQNSMSKVIQGKTMSVYEESYRVEKPTGTFNGTWDIRVSRYYRESVGAEFTDRIDWFAMTEIQDLKITYPDAAIAGIYIDAEATGGAIPARSYLTQGRIISVPSNYVPPVVNQTTGVIDSYASYNGEWDGTFQQSWSNCPAWVLYDILTHERYGMGSYIDPSSVNIYDFYEASKYCAELILKGNGTQEREPRFTFNYQFQSREDAYSVLQSIAASFRAVLVSAPGTIRLIQDRPAAPIATVNNANVINGGFNYSGSELTQRITSVNVSYFDNADGAYNKTTITEDAEPADIARYGFNKQEFTPIGVATESQARRLAKWALDNSLNQTEMVAFEVSWAMAHLEVYDIIEVADNNYAAIQFSGQLRVGEMTGVNNITFDRELTLTSGQEVNFMTFAGQEQVRNIAMGGTGTSFTLVPKTGALNPNEYPNAPFLIRGPVFPRQFRVVSIAESETGKYAIQAAYHDPYKYARIEQGIYVKPPVFSDITNWVVGQPQNLTSTVEPYLTPVGLVRYKLHLEWDKVDGKGMNVNYRLHYRRNNGQYIQSDVILATDYTIDDCLPGVYEYVLYAYNTRGVQSPPAEGWYQIEQQSTAPSPLPSAGNLRLTTGGTAFTGQAFTILWNPIESTVNATLKNYELRLYNGTSSSGSLFRTIQTNDVRYAFSRSDIITWAGSAIRNIHIEVRGMDTLERYTLPTGATFTNAAPPVLTGVQITPFFTYYMVEHIASTAPDLAGVRIWASKTTGFTPNKSNEVYDGIGNIHMVSAESDTTYYVRLAAYDDWSDLNLNMTSEFSVTTASNIIGIIPEPPTNLSVTSTLFESTPGNFEAKVDVSWDKMPKTNQYDLYINAPSIGDVRVESVSQPNETATRVSYTFNTKTAVAYTFQIRSRAATFVSEWSNTVSHTTVRTTAAPAAPTNFTATAGFVSASLRWTNPTASDLAAVEVYRRRITAPAVAEALVDTVNVTSLVNLSTAYIGNLEGDVQYAFRIRAINRSGLASPYTALVNVTPLPLDTEIGPGEITGTMIADDSISTPKLQANSVVAGKLAADSVTAREIVSGTITATEIAVGSLTGNLIAGRTITADKLVANTITATEINAASVRTAILVANVINADMIMVDAVTAKHVGANTIITNSANIASAVITNGMIQDATIQGAKIANATIGAAQIGDGQITNAKIQNASIDSAKIANTIQSANYQYQVSGWAFTMGGELYINGNSGGNRMIISNSNIQVYDAANRLRVRMGIWG